jgi:predicted transcriptional regulator
MTVANYSFAVDAELMKRFEELAGQDDGDSAELLRSFIAHYVATGDTDAEYDAWLRAKVRKSMEVANAGGIVDGDEVEAEFAARREASRMRLARQ